ncbi:MAG: hypothetical protein JOY98_13460, partial [Candidatus Eremiobacteraeota bacterium]|nr:hypothetical protein [Candidatus Eremiobacteraeota bacterium]
ARQLGAAAVTEKLTKSRAIKFVVGGVVARTSISGGSGSVPAIDPMTLPLTFAAYDADNDIIVTDTYVDSRGKTVTIAMTADTAAGTTITFAPASFTTQPSSVTLTYAPGAMSGTQAQNGFATLITGQTSNAAPAAGITLTFNAPHVTLYPVTTANSHPSFITSGPDGALWFTEANANKIGRITTAGIITNEYSSGPSGSQPDRITAGPDGNVWFTAILGNSVNKIDSSGTVTPFVIPTLNSYPEGIVAGPDGNMWVALEGTNRILRLSTDQSSYIEPSLGGAPKPEGITVNNDALWFTDFNSNQLDRMTTAGNADPPLSTGSLAVQPWALTAGSDGALWFAGCNGYIGRMTTNGTVTPYQITGMGGGEASDVTVGPDGAIWFTVQTSSTIQSIGRISTAGVMTLYPVETTPANPLPSGITKGPDGAIWFVEYNANMVGRLQ